MASSLSNRLFRAGCGMAIALLLLVQACPANAVTPKIVASDGNNCLLRSDGSVSCWGYEGNGVNSPPPGPFLDISVGAWSACGLRSGGQVICWGDENTTLNGLLDVPPGNYLQVDAGDYFNCALRDDQKVVCWGEQVGGVYIPFTADDDLFTKVDTGWSRLCAIRTDGRLACAGLGVIHEVPEGTFVDVVGPDANATACAIRSDSQVVCWGFEFYGQTSPPAGTFVSVGLGGYHACGLRTDGTISCWGYYGNQDYYQYYQPEGQYTSLAVGFVHNCAIRIDGVTVCWGNGAGAASPQLVIAPKQVLAGELGLPYSTTFSMQDASTNVDKYQPVDPLLALSAGSLPPGLSWGTNGQVTGTPTDVGQWLVSILAQDANGYEVTRDVALTVVAPGEDTTPPEIVPHVTGINQAFDWYRSDMVIEWLVSDAESGATTRVGCDTTAITEDTPRKGVVLVCSARSTGGVASESLHFRRDATPPSVSIDSVEPLADEGYFKVHFTTADTTSTVAFAECALDDGGFSFCDERFAETVGPLAPGAHTVKVRAADNAGNYSDPVSYEIGGPPADVTPPVITANVTGSLGNAGWYVGDVAIAWVVSDAESTISSTTGCGASGVSSDTAASSFTCAATSAGGTADQSVTVKRDATAPSTSLDSGPTNPTNSTSATFVFSGSDVTSGPSGFACNLDGAGFSTCTSPRTINGLAPGPHTFSVRATDVAGNADASPAASSWTIQTTDATPPSANPTFSKPPNSNGWYAANVTITWNWTDAGTGVNPNQCTKQTTSNADGNLTILATCRDKAGNLGNASVQLNVDRIAPLLAPYPSVSPVLLRGTSLAFPNAVDALSGIASATCPTLATNLAGDFALDCTATDRAGNVSKAKVSYAVRYGVIGFSAPLVMPPGVNLVHRTDVVPLRWRLVDANGAPITTLKVADVKLSAAAMDAGICTSGAPNVVSESGSTIKVFNLGNGYYQAGLSFNKLSSLTCFFVVSNSPLESKFVYFQFH